jgi:NAD(P) transhydrogenase subunit alpha
MKAGGPLTVGVPREAEPDEHRVSLVPDQVSTLRAAGLAVVVEAGAGAGAYLTDEAYAGAGAEILPAEEVIARADILLGVNRPAPDLQKRLRAGQVLIGLLRPRQDPAFAADLAGRQITMISLDELPRTLSRGQSMDALTSQANVAGYKAVLVAANAFGRYFPMLVTAAGTARPARVLVLGAGVAGLQAIGTARRLGAVVAAYDIRPEARGDVESVGATFLDLASGPADGSGEGGYGRALSGDEAQALREALAPHLARYDVVITTAQTPGRKPPLLISEEAVKNMAAGSVIVDIAASPQGGNSELSRPGETVVTENGVTVIGAGNLASEVPTAASNAYSRNVATLLANLVRDGQLNIDLSDEIQAGVVITHGGEVVHPAIAQLLETVGSPE